LLADFLYSHPTWVVAVLIIGLWTGISLLGLRFFHSKIDVQTRHKDTETVGLTFAIVAVVYAVLLAIITVDVYEKFAKAETIATAESNRLSNLLLDSSGLPPAMAAEMHSDINNYIDIVVKSEWPSQQAGKRGLEVFEPGWTVLAHISTELAVYEPATKGQSIDKAEMLHALNDLIKARRGRIIAASGHLPAVLWKMLVLGGVVSIGYTYLFGARTFGIHVAITGLIATTIGLVFVLIIVLDYPFRGTVSVSSDSFLTVQQNASQALAATPLH
jgi:hypothetical protein